MTPVGYLPDVGPLYAVKLMKPAYRELSERSEASKDPIKGPLQPETPFWLYMGKDVCDETMAMIFTPDPWWMKTQFAGLCDIAGIRNKTGDA